MSESNSRIDYVTGDFTGLAIPAHGEALAAGGAVALTEAFRAFGSIGGETRVAAITRLESCPGGSTGEKFFLSLDFESSCAQSHRDLFVKFSRDFNDPLRDHARFEMEAEVRFAALSRRADFPIPVPTAYFADYHQPSGTGLLITERIPFGRDGIEPQHAKCWDHELTDPLSYYRTVVLALARLAAAHKSGRLAAEVEAWFPYDRAAAIASDPIRHDSRKLEKLIDDYAAFVARCPQLVPENIRSAAFIATLRAEAGRFLQHEQTIKNFLQSNPDLIALCHWNAHLDNAWFWRNGAGELECGLMDWGRVRQLNVAYALWGCLSGATVELWDAHADELLELFVAELHAQGGPALDVEELRLHLHLYVATMGLAWLLGAPARIAHRLPEVATASGPHDPLFRRSESARNQLHIATVFLNLWQTQDFGASLSRLLARPR